MTVFVAVLTRKDMLCNNNNNKFKNSLQDPDYRKKSESLCVWAVTRCLVDRSLICNQLHQSLSLLLVCDLLVTRLAVLFSCHDFLERSTPFLAIAGSRQCCQLACLPPSSLWSWVCQRENSKGNNQPCLRAAAATSLTLLEVGCCLSWASNLCSSGSEAGTRG